jgi:hypothetical protein
MNEITAEIPNVDETSKGIDSGARDITGQADVDTIPETIRDLLSDPPLLDHENEEDFRTLFESFRAYAEPENIVDYHLVFNATVSKWEIARYRFMATAVTSNQQQAGLKALFMQTHSAAAVRSAQPRIGGLMEMEATMNAMRCLTDPVYRDEAYTAFESMGYTPDGQAFLLSLPALATIERLAASAEKRYVASIKEIEKRRADRAAKRRLASSHTINGGSKEADKV